MSKASNRMQRRLDQVKKMTTKAVAAAMNAASESLELKIQEIAALKRILIAERAQVVYYTEQYQRLEMSPVGFLDLPEAKQESYVKRAVIELRGEDGTLPHEPEKKIHLA